MADYIGNVWYMAAWEQEVPDGGSLARTFMDESWLLYRRQESTGYAMVADRCPHRLAPLSRGRRQGDTVICPYHGLEFGLDGECRRNPFSDAIPARARLTTWPVIARYGALWFWPGDPARSDPAQIPDFSVLDDPEPVVRGTTRFAANYEIIADNLMDLSHAEFLHIDTFKTEGKIFAGRHNVLETGDGAIWSNWSMSNTKPPAWLPMLAKDARLDEWLEMRWHAPASMLLHIGYTIAGTPRNAAPAPAMINPHIITPETRTASHYFFTRSPGAESEAMAQKVFEEEDRPMLEAIQNRMGDKDFWDWKPAILNVDAAGIRVRRRLMKMRLAEQEATRGATLDA